MRGICNINYHFHFFSDANMIRAALSSPLLSTFYTFLPSVLPIPNCSFLILIILFLFFLFLQVAQADHISQTNSLQTHVKSLEVRTVLTHTRIRML